MHKGILILLVCGMVIGGILYGTDTVYAGVIGLLFFLYLFSMKEINIERTKNVSSIGFLCLLIIIVANQFYEFLGDYNNLIYILTMVFGIVTFWLHKEIAEEVEKEKEEEEAQEEKRKNEFPEKFPTIDSIPIIRPIVKWMYKEGWWYSLALILIVLLGFELRIWNLGYLGLWDDEGQVYIAAKNILSTGLPYLDSGYLYSRDLPHLYLTSLSLLLFGKSEFALRLPSVLAGTLLIFVMYFIIKEYTDKNIAIIGILITAIHPWIIGGSRLCRSYILMLLFIAITFYFFTNMVINPACKRNYILVSIFGFLSCLTHQTGQMVFFLIVPFLFLKLHNFSKIKSFNFRKSLIETIPFFIILSSIFIYKILFKFSFFAHTDQFMTAAPVQKSLIETIFSYMPFDLSFQLSNITFIKNSTPIIFLLAIIFIAITIPRFQNLPLKNKSFILTLLIFFIALGLSKKNITINRAVLFIFPFLLTSSLILIYKIKNLVPLFNKKLFYIVLIGLTMVTLSAETSNILLANYGDQINPYHSPFEGFNYRQDNKTTYEFLNKNYKNNGDLIIVFGNPKFSAFYLREDLNVDYFVWTGNTKTVNNGMNVYLSNCKLIDNMEEYEKVIKNHNVWIVTTYSIGNLYRIYHINSTFKNYIKKLNPVYQSNDPYARVYYVQNN